MSGEFRTPLLLCLIELSLLPFPLGSHSRRGSKVLHCKIQVNNFARQLLLCVHFSRKKDCSKLTTAEHAILYFIVITKMLDQILVIFWEEEVLIANL